MEPRAWIKTLTFSDGTPIQLGKDDVIVVVGPNNSGKSATLRAIRDKFAQPSVSSVVVKNVVVEREGNADDLIGWLESSTKRMDQPNKDDVFQAFGHGVHLSQARQIWGNPGSLGQLALFFCHLLTADERLAAANPASNIALAREAPQHPIHFLQRDDALEEELSQQFKKAFGLQLIVHRNAGNQVPIHVGEKPKMKAGLDRVSLEYVVELEKLPRFRPKATECEALLGSCCIRRSAGKRFS